MDAQAALKKEFEAAGAKVLEGAISGRALYDGRLDPAGLPAPQDTELLKKLAMFPEVVEKAAREHEPHRICVFLEELAAVAHGWYHHTRTVGEASDVERSRLLLARAARIVLANGLSILGLTAPDRM